MSTEQENGKTKGPNGSVDLLAQAMSKVFSEAMEGCLNDRIDTTDENMQAQITEQEKKIGRVGSDVSNIQQMLRSGR